MKAKSIKGYVCTVSLVHDLPLGYKKLQVFTTIKALKEACSCVKECGITEVKIVKVKTVTKGTL